VLPALRLKQVDAQGVLKLSTFAGPAHADISPYPKMAAGDVIETWVQTSTGNSCTYKTPVTQAMVGYPTVVEILRAVFEKDLVPGATAKLGYTVFPAAGTPTVAPDLVVKVEK
ncbi:hypothetical protein, partial [Pseudomonas frederiksbergensis]|uniref:hypothetical protein n=1 Tax=Pseudomonas frederiksbergensis TaxID=104087 RepID=UPI00197D7C38